MALLLACLVLLLASAPAQAAPGALDPSFGQDGWLMRDRDESPISIDHVFHQSGGRVVIAGQGELEYEGRLVLSRLLPDGRLDTSFGEGGTVTSRVSGVARVALQPDGRIVVAGSARSSYEAPFEPLAERYSADGARDVSFDGGSVTLPSGSGLPQYHEFSALEISGDGRITLVAGPRSTYDPGRDVTILRLLPNGKLDTSFGGDGVAVLRPTGDPAALSGALPRSGGRLLVVGWTGDEGRGGEFVEPERPMILLVRRDGTLDRTFGKRGVRVLMNPDDAGPLQAVAPGRGGRIVTLHRAASRQQYGRINTAYVLRGLRADGSNDRSFGRRGMGRIDRPSHYDDYWDLNAGQLLRQPDGKYLVIGSLSYCEDRGPCYGHPVVARFTATGRRDGEFGTNGRVIAQLPYEPTDDIYGGYTSHGRLAAGSIAGDERLVVGGSFNYGRGLLGRFQDVVAPRIALLPRTLEMGRNGGVHVDVECEEAGPLCEGYALLRTGRRVLDDEQFSLSPGGRARVRLRLSRSERRVVRRRGSRVTGLLRVRDAAGNSLPRERVLTLRGR